MRCSAGSPLCNIWGLKGQRISVFQPEQRTQHSRGGGARVLFDARDVSLGTSPFWRVFSVRTFSPPRNEITSL